MPLLSVIIPCRNERAFVGHCLDSILASDFPGEFEIVIADGMSDDGTREALARYQARDPRVRVLDNPRRITPAALNLALAAARGEFIARVDAHWAIAPDYLARCVHYLETTEADNVGGRVRTLPQTSGPFAEAIVAGLSHRFGVGNAYYRIGHDQPRWVDTVLGGCWRRSLFDRLGTYNENLVRTQDMEFSLRLKAAGGKTLLAPDVRSDFFVRSRLGAFWRHNVLNGQWAVLPFLYSDVIPVSLRHLIPLIFVGALALATLALPWTALPLAAIAISYVAANFAASIHASWRARKPSLLALLPIVFAGLHFGYGLGSLAGVFRTIAARSRGTRPRLKETACLPQQHP